MPLPQVQQVPVSGPPGAVVVATGAVVVSWGTGAALTARKAAAKRATIEKRILVKKMVF